MPADVVHCIDGDVELPQFYIRNNVLEHYYGVADSVVIPENVKSIAGGAFTDCNGITNIVFHSGITELVKHTFVGCNGIERLDLPKSILKVEDEAFLNCIGLKFVIVRGETKVGDEAFEGCYNLSAIVHNN